MDQTLAGYVRALRAAGADASTAEALDAARVVTLVGYADRAVLKDALGLVLAKTEAEKALHESVFEQYFKSAASEATQDDADERSQTRTPAPSTGDADADALLSLLGQGQGGGDGGGSGPKWPDFPEKVELEGFYHAKFRKDMDKKLFDEDEKVAAAHFLNAQAAAANGDKEGYKAHIESFFAIEERHGGQKWGENIMDKVDAHVDGNTDDETFDRFDAGVANMKKWKALPSSLRSKRAKTATVWPS